jgi:chitosanase
LPSTRLRPTSIVVILIAVGAVATVVAVLIWKGPSAGQSVRDGHAPPAEVQRRIADQMVSVFENNDPTLRYDYIRNLNDGRGFTAGRAGFCTGCGDLDQVVHSYTSAAPDNPLAQYLPELDRLATASSDDITRLDGFTDAWKQTAADPMFRRVQDEMVDQLYYQPAAEVARQDGVHTPLGIVALYDTAIEHGVGTGPDARDALSGIVTRTISVTGGTPASGVDELDWLRAFLTVRRDTLQNPTDPATAEVWRASVGRVDTLRSLLDEGKSSLQPPITIRPFGKEFTLT